MSTERWAPRATVAVVVCDNQGRYLLVEEKSRAAEHAGVPSVFNQPAGHLELNESLREATLRETREESGWEVALTGYLGFYSNQAPNGVVYHSHTLIAEPVKALDTELDTGIIAVHWLGYDEICTLAEGRRLRSPLVLARIDDHRRGDHFPLSLLHEQYPD